VTFHVSSAKTPKNRDFITIYSNRCPLQVFRLLCNAQHTVLLSAEILSQKRYPTPRFSSAKPPLLHSSRRVRMTLRPSLNICRRRRSPHTIPSTRLRPSVHLNRAARHPNTKQPAPAHVSISIQTLKKSHSTYSNAIARISVSALSAAAAPLALPTPIPVTTSTASQNTTSTLFRMAFAFVLAHLRKRARCSVRSW